MGSCGLGQEQVEGSCKGSNELNDIGNQIDATITVY